ncbi:YceI family protein [Actinomarinicola tropica]|uniref:Polyisoprenoid-binding protein n=1 Tax=Actinomarinicola tropica TaxID=2789776 RepID=A0A5Q2RLJ0_9ACTN|nr:YceI family protein [Actinomarinicola tropica]QGG94937.1 polyisoprenoid-binding protein [Actinomarinicola tropica]
MSTNETVIPTREFEGVTIPTPGTFEIDPSHSTVQFVARHMMVSKVRGTFESYSGTIVVAEDPLASSVEVAIDVSSITTRDEGRDTHLKSADFFDVETYPSITFRSSGVRHTGGTSFEVEGELTVRGTTKPLTLEVELEGIGKDPWGNERIGFSTKVELDREEFGLTWNQALETGGVLVGKKITVDIDVEATRQA